MRTARVTIANWLACVLSLRMPYGWMDAKATEPRRLSCIPGPVARLVFTKVLCFITWISIIKCWQIRNKVDGTLQLYTYYISI